MIEEQIKEYKEETIRAFDEVLEPLYLTFEASEAEDLHCEIAKVAQNLLTQQREEAIRWTINNINEVKRLWTEDSKANPDRADPSLLEFAMEIYQTQQSLDKGDGE